MVPGQPRIRRAPHPLAGPIDTLRRIRLIKA